MSAYASLGRIIGEEVGEDLGSVNSFYHIINIIFSDYFIQIRLIQQNNSISSLLNILVGEEKAIVTDIAGTTRDTLEEIISLGGITLSRLICSGSSRADSIKAISYKISFLRLTILSDKEPFSSFTEDCRANSFLACMISITASAFDKSIL